MKVVVEEQGRHMFLALVSCKILIFNIMIIKTLAAQLFLINKVYMSAHEIKGDRACVCEPGGPHCHL